jgi:hypothetical protein
METMNEQIDQRTEAERQLRLRRLRRRLDRALDAHNTQELNAVVGTIFKEIREEQ